MEIAVLKDKYLEEYSKFVAKIIFNIPYYSNLSKKEEIKKFSSLNLRKNIKDKNKLYICAIEDKKIIGFVCGYFDAGTFWIDWIGISQRFRNKGVAENLENYLEKILRKSKIHKIWCDSRTNNKEVINLFKKLGFRKITKISKHWYKLDFYLWEKLL
jgi:ribosomal protein S18 acetylase RimI-like enzyme